MLKNDKNICILGGNDDLTLSFYLHCKKKFKKTIDINFSGRKNKKKFRIYKFRTMKVNKDIEMNFSGKKIKSLDKRIYNLNLYELKNCLSILNKNQINEIVILGKIFRPNLSKFKLDGVVDFYLNKLIDAFKKGDG